MSQPIVSDKDKIREIAREGYEKGKVFNPVQFSRDFTNILTTKKMISRFLKSGSLNERLMINNTIIALNVFGPEKVNLIFRLLCDDVQFSVIKAILLFLRSYDFRHGDEVYPNRIIVDVLKDMTVRYNLDPNI